MGGTSLLGGMLFLKAVIAGFVVAVPIGAIGMLCLRCALQGRWTIGLVAGLGAAVADCLLAAAAVFGLALVNHYILGYQEPLRLVGGLFLVALGVWMIGKRNQTTDTRPDGPRTQLRRMRDATGAFSTGFVLTIINPATFFAFGGVLAAFGLFGSSVEKPRGHGLIVAGVFVGSLLWWLTLTAGSAALRRHIPETIAGSINAALGTLVVFFGLAALISLFESATP